MPLGIEDVDKHEQLPVTGIVLYFLGGQLTGAESHRVPTAIDELYKHSTNSIGRYVSFNTNRKRGVKVD